MSTKYVCADRIACCLLKFHTKSHTLHCSHNLPGFTSYRLHISSEISHLFKKQISVEEWEGTKLESFPYKPNTGERAESRGASYLLKLSKNGTKPEFFLILDFCSQYQYLELKIFWYVCMGKYSIYEHKLCFSNTDKDMWRRWDFFFFFIQLTKPSMCKITLVHWISKPQAHPIWIGWILELHWHVKLFVTFLQPFLTSFVVSQYA